MVQEANFVYIVALAHILNNPTASDRGKVAFDIAYKLAQSDMCPTVDQQYGEKVEWWMDYAKGWADEAKKEKANGMKAPFLTQINDPGKLKGKDPNTALMMGPLLIDIKKQQGFMKHAICLSFFYMLMADEYELNYKDCIREIISMSGDTDTNACIAGAVVGALVGFNKIDESMVQKLLECDVTGEGRIRPDWLSVGRVGVKNIQKLIEVRAGDSYQFVNHP